MKDSSNQIEIQVLQRQKFELSKKIDQLLKENNQLAQSVEDTKAEKAQEAKVCRNFKVHFQVLYQPRLFPVIQITNFGWIANHFCSTYCICFAIICVCSQQIK